MFHRFEGHRKNVILGVIKLSIAHFEVTPYRTHMKSHISMGHQMMLYPASLSSFRSLVSEILACAPKTLTPYISETARMTLNNSLWVYITLEYTNVLVKFEENRATELSGRKIIIFFTNCPLCIKNYEGQCQNRQKRRGQFRDLPTAKR
jgi:hypothetical protein